LVWTHGSIGRESWQSGKFGENERVEIAEALVDWSATVSTEWAGICQIVGHPMHSWTYHWRASVALLSVPARWEL
jgi:hypothetical protein